MKSMFHKVNEDIRSIVRWLFVVLMSIQIVLGLGWIFFNMDHLPQFHETELVLKASENLVIDEYMGILYPLLIKIAGWIGQILPVPYYSMIYVVQLFAAGYAAVYFLRRSGWIRERIKFSNIMLILSVGYFLTFPLLLQMHMAVLPYSLASSAAVILICDGFHYLRCPEEVCGTVLIRLCVLWLLTILLLPEYSILSGVFVIGIMLGVMQKNKKWRMRILVSILCTVLSVGVIENTTQTPASMGRIQKSVSAAMMQRFVWPNLVSYSYFWPEEVGETFTFEELTDVARYSEGLIYKFGYIMDEKYGRNAAGDMYFEMALAALNLDTKRIVGEIGTDLLAYLCPPISFRIQQESNSSALLSWNYGRLQEEAPLLTKYYVNLSFAGWNIMCILSLLLILLKSKKFRISYGEMVLGVSAVVMAVWYTMQGAGMQDYKKVMLLSLLWMLPVIRGFLSANKEKNEDKGNE